MTKRKRTEGFTIYALLDPRTGLTRYIGITCRPLSQRIGQHLTSTKAPPGMRAWILGLKDAGLKPIVVSLVKLIASDDDLGEYDSAPFYPFVKWVTEFLERDLICRTNLAPGAKLFNSDQDPISARKAPASLECIFGPISPEFARRR